MGLHTAMARANTPHAGHAPAASFRVTNPSKVRKKEEKATILARRLRSPAGKAGGASERSDAR